jgi:hypothetical protein
MGYDCGTQEFLVILAHVQLIVPHNQLILCPASVCG